MISRELTRNVVSFVFFIFYEFRGNIKKKRTISSDQKEAGRFRIPFASTVKHTFLQAEFRYQFETLHGVFNIFSCPVVRFF